MYQASRIELGRLAQDFQLKRKQVENVVELLDAGNTVPFITRFRKEQTGSLDEEQIREIQRRVQQLRQIAERRDTIVRSLETQGKLTDELREALESAGSMKRLEDLYLPFKPKKQTLATIARGRGLGPIADAIWSADETVANLDEILQGMLDPEKQLNEPQDILTGVQHILAEKISEEAEVRGAARQVLWTGQVQSAKATAETAGDAQAGESKAGREAEFRNYFDYSESLSQIPPHRVLAINRGERAGVLKVRIVYDAAQLKEAVNAKLPLENHPHAEFLKQCAADSIERLLARSLEREIRTELAERAEEHAVGVFARNLRTLLLQPPVPKHRVLAIDPGYRSGCKVAVLDEFGNLLAHDIVFPHSRRKKKRKKKTTEVKGAAKAEPKKGDDAATAKAAEKKGDDGTPPPILPADSFYRSIPQDGMEPNKEDAEPSGDPAPGDQPSREAAPAEEANAAESSPTAEEPQSPAAEHAAEEPQSPAASHTEHAEEAPPDPQPPAGTEETHDVPEHLKAVSEIVVESAESGDETDYVTHVETSTNDDDASAGHGDDPPGLETTVAIVAEEFGTGEVEIIEPEPSETSDAAQPQAEESDKTKDSGAAQTPQEPQKSKRQLAIETIQNLCNTHDVKVVAIGNGTGCRETEEFIAELIEKEQLAIPYVVVNESGASVYSTSSVGREEFPDFDPTLRGTISIGRRLQDPLSELVKIEPQNIGVGLYQHDANPRRLKESLAQVVESCVNFVGVDVNTASVPLLQYISGLNLLRARNLVEHRKANGPFTNREQIKSVAGIGPAVFTQAAGFLKITGGDQPFDATWIHPESYPAAIKVLETVGLEPSTLLDRQRMDEFKGKLADLNRVELAEKIGVGEATVEDILENLTRPGRDPREDFSKPIFRKGILRLEDLTPGMQLQGTVLNVVDFGAFVDIGLKDSCLVHISELANRFVRSPHDLVSVGDTVTTWVLKVDAERRRVSLTMIAPGSDRAHAGGHRPKQQRQPRQQRPPQRQPRGEGQVASREERPQQRQDQGRSYPNRQQQRKKAVRMPQQRPRKAAPPPKLSSDALEGKAALHTFGELKAFFDHKKKKTDDKDGGKE